MNIYQAIAFINLCQKAGFTTIGEVFCYMQRHGINCKQLSNILRYECGEDINIIINGVAASREDREQLKLDVLHGRIKITDAWTLFSMIFIETN